MLARKLLSCVFLSSAVIVAQAAEVNLVDNHISLDGLTSMYNKYGCPGVVDIDHEEERAFSLLSLEDLLESVVADDASTLTNDIAGNIRVVSLVRHVNENYMGLREYAKRADVNELIKKDIEDLKEFTTDAALDAAFESMMTKLEIIQYLKDLKSRSFQPIEALVQEGEIKRSDFFAHVFYCRIYEMIFVEDSEGDRMLGQYLSSLSRTALNENLNRLREKLYIE